jgi:endonuclease G
MKEFKLALRRSGKPPLFERAIHTDDLSNRAGYDPQFLGAPLPLPAIAAADQAAVATVQNNIGANGNKVLDYTHFSVVFNKDKKMPFYTAVNMVGDSNLLGKMHEERGSDVWNTDDRIVVGGDKFQYGNGDYGGTGLAKGHMVRYYDPAWGAGDEPNIAIGDTFHYTNCCPQIPYFNGVVWNYLEDYCAARNIFQDNHITLFAGPIFNQAQTINGLLAPMNFWKILIYKKGNALSALGFVMSQQPYLDKLKKPQAMLLEALVKQVGPTLKQSDIQRLFQKKEMLAAQIKISLIEEKTGLTFGLNSFDEFKDRGQFAAESVVKPVNHIMKFQEFRESMDTFQWAPFLQQL